MNNSSEHKRIVVFNSLSCFNKQIHEKNVINLIFDNNHFFGDSRIDSFYILDMSLILSFTFNSFSFTQSRSNIFTYV